VSLLKKPIDKIKNNRLRRLKIKTLPYTFVLEYVPGLKLNIADLLSRNIVHTTLEVDSEMTDVVHTVQIAPELLISARKVKLYQMETLNDEALSLVLKYYKNGWPKNINRNITGEIKHFFKLRYDITVQDDLVYLDNKIIIPKNLRKTILTLLHETHLSAHKQKFLAKSIFYWLGINSDIFNFVEDCSLCQKFKRNQIKQTLINHEIPKAPFLKIGMDIAEYKGSNYLIVVDYYSRWLEIIEIRHKDSSTIISKLKPLFSKFGIPVEIIADNMPFSSREFLKFGNDWEFEVNTASPHYPQSNGLAEKGVGIAKKILQKCKEEGQDTELYLLNYRNSNVPNLDFSPAQLLLNRNLRSKLPTLIDEVTAKLNKNAYEQMIKNKQKQKNYFYKSSSKTKIQFNVK